MSKLNSKYVVSWILSSFSNHFLISSTLEIKSNYKTNLSERTAYKKLLELSNNNLEIADKIIMQSIENDWKGLFELKNNEKKGSTLNF